MSQIPANEQAAEALFLSHLALVDRIIGAIGKRHALSRTDLEDFRAWVRLKLIEDEYSILRKFGGRSSLSTYLTVVIGNLYRDYCNSQWGRWRPSAAATRLGPLAMRLETLVYRDGCSVREAFELLQSNQYHALPKELQRLLSMIPARMLPREVELDSTVVDRTSGSFDVADHKLWDEATEEASVRLQSQLQQVMAALSPEDQVLLRMRYWEGFTIAQAARALGLEQKPLYRRLEGIHAKLREGLIREGVDRDQVVSILGRDPGDSA